MPILWSLNFFFCPHCFFSFWFKQHQLSVPATPNLAKPIGSQVGTEEMSSNVTDTILPKVGTASQMLLAPECLLHQWRNIIVALMRRDGWMASIQLKMMELSSDRFASTGATAIVSGAYRSVFVTVGDSTSIGCQGSLSAIFVTVDTTADTTAIVRIQRYVSYPSVNIAISSWCNMISA